VHDMIAGGAMGVHRREPDAAPSLPGCGGWSARDVRAAAPNCVQGKRRMHHVDTRDGAGVVEYPPGDDDDAQHPLAQRRIRSATRRRGACRRRGAPASCVLRRVDDAFGLRAQFYRARVQRRLPLTAATDAVTRGRHPRRWERPAGSTSQGRTSRVWPAARQVTCAGPTAAGRRWGRPSLHRSTGRGGRCAVPPPRPSRRRRPAGRRR
jgi:hypothetical protein